ncbi:MAG: hypothetical protein LUD00_04580 [Prevotellaceae bacterium]|nr:hypothetical protein [Prevotellaceae bacterium]
MILDSSDSLSIARSETYNWTDDYICPRNGEHPILNSWCYLYMHRAKVKSFVAVTHKYFRCFVHETIYRYARSKNDTGEILKPTISGLVFIQGNPDEIKTYLKHNFSDCHLAKDCSAKEVAVISHKVMQPFMRVSEYEPTRIRFLMHPLDHYAKGRPLVRFTSGILHGCEGYIVRIDRDRKLVMQIGDMTVAIGNIHKEHFENIDDPDVPENIRESLLKNDGM